MSKIKTWANLPAYQRKAAVELIREVADTREILARELRGTAEQHAADEDGGAALRAAVNALETMTLKELRHGDD